MKVNLILFTSTLLFLAIACDNPKAEPKTTEKPPLKVTYHVVDPEPLQDKIKLTGTLMAQEEVQLTGEVSGLITGIYFDEGERKAKGDLLVKINDADLQAQLNRAEATLKLRKATEARQRRLLEREAISQEEYDNALTQLNTQLAEIELIRAQIQRTEIRAPFDGILGLREVSVGALMNPGMVLAQLYDTDKIKVDFAVPGKYAKEIEPGDRIYFTVETFNKEFEAEVYAVEPRIDPNTRLINARAIADNTSGELVPGQFARIELVLSVKPEAALIPSEAVIPELNGHYVYVSNKGRPEKRTVQLGIRTPDDVEIAAGLQDGDTVITSGLLQIQPDTRLEFITYDNKNEVL